MNNSPLAPASAPWTDRYLPGSDSHAAPLMDVQRLRGFVWRQRYVLVGVTILGILVGLILTMLAVPVYQATSTVRVDPQTPDIFQGESLTPETIKDPDAYMTTLAEVAKSHSMALQVVDVLHLERDPAFRGDVTDRPAGVSDAQWKTTLRNHAASALQDNVLAETARDSQIMAISYNSTDPRKAARIANAYATNFLTDDLRRSLQKNAYAAKYLQEQINDTRAKLDAAERGALTYARSNRIVGQALVGGGSSEGAGDTAAPQTVTAANLAAINSTYADARAKRIAAEGRWRVIANQSPAQLPEVQQNSAIQQLVAQRASALSDLSDLRTRYGPAYPGIKEQQAKVNTLDQQIAQLSANVKNALRQDYTTALRQEQGLSSELNRVSEETLDEQVRRVTFNQMNSNAQSLQTQLQALLARYNQIVSAANVKPSSITLLDQAVTPSDPVSPNLFKNILIALVLGGGLAAALAVVRETLDDRLRSAEDVERKLRLPLLGTTPLVADTEDVDNSPPLLESYSSIKAAVDFVLPHPIHNVVMLTSSQSAEGKSTSAIALAREYARLGRKVLLVDADLRRPSLARSFGAQRPKKGFVEVLAGEATLAEALLKQPAANLDVLSVGAIPANPVEIVSSQRFEDFFTRQRREYDLVVVDSPPIMGIADAPLLSRVADAVLFVVESNRAHFGQTRSAVRRLRDVGGNVVGVVLTKFRALEAGQSYGYNYDYYTYQHSQGE